MIVVSGKVVLQDVGGFELMDILIEGWDDAYTPTCCLQGVLRTMRDRKVRITIEPVAEDDTPGWWE